MAEAQSGEERVSFVFFGCCHSFLPLSFRRDAHTTHTHTHIHTLIHIHTHTHTHTHSAKPLFRADHSRRSHLSFSLLSPHPPPFRLSLSPATMKQHLRHSLPRLLIALFFVSAASALTLHIDSIRGDDAADGHSPARPLKTLVSACGQAEGRIAITVAARRNGEIRRAHSGRCLGDKKKKRNPRRPSTVVGCGRKKGAPHTHTHSRTKRTY